MSEQKWKLEVLNFIKRVNTLFIFIYFKYDLRLTILNMIGDGLRHKDILLAFPKDLLTTQTISNVFNFVENSWYL